MGLGIRRPVPGRGDICQLPAPQARPARSAADPHPARRRLQPAPAAGSRARGQMNLTRRIGSGRGRLSLRSRLLAGLITVTALFLIIMGVVTTVVLGNSEQDQFKSDLALTVRLKLSELDSLQGGYTVAYYNVPTRSVRVLTPPSHAQRELTAFLDQLAAHRKGWLAFQAEHPPNVLFTIDQPGPALTAVWRFVTPTEAQRSEGTLLPGKSILGIARPDRAGGRGG